MEAKIIERGRGPEIEGTRITVYRIMDNLRYNDTPDMIAADLSLTPEQVQVALQYIDEHRTEVEAEYARIVERANQRKNPEWVEVGRAKTFEELKQRILSRRSPPNGHPDCGGQ